VETLIFFPFFSNHKGVLPLAQNNEKGYYLTMKHNKLALAPTM
jgi:hypothetical protein